MSRVSSGSGSARSDRSETSQSSEYIKYDLFEDVELTSSKHVKIVEGDEKISKNLELQRIILELRDRELARVKIDKRNKILATLICYRKDDFAASFKEIPITLPEDMVEGYSAEDGSPPNYKKEVRDEIFGVERAAVSDGLRRRNAKINEIQKGYKIEFLRMKDADARLAAQSSNLDLLKAEMESISEASDEERVRLIFAVKKTLTDYRVRLPETESLPELIKIFSDFSDEKIASLKKERRDLHEGEFNVYRAKDRLLESELKKIKKLLDSPSLLESAVREQRGHSEDYLHYAMQQDYFMKPLAEQIPAGSDRFYLMIFSTRDACKRCSSKVEEMAEIMNRTFNSEGKSEVKCKILYFAREQMRDRSGSGYESEYDDRITGDNLSNSAKAALHFQPTRLAAEGEKSAADAAFVSRNLTSPGTSVGAQSGESLAGERDSGRGGGGGGGGGEGRG